MNSKTFFARGASYYPPHHDPEQWARDVAAMAEAGMNCVRSAELLASWDYIEKVRGEPDWGWLDALFEQAQRHGIGILLGTGSPSPPIWLLDHYPDAQIVDREGRPFPTGTVWGWACRNHPGYRAEVERYLRLLLDRYTNHPALWAWQIDNEPGFPFILRRGEEALRIYDYNPHTASAFRAWLQHTYGTLDELNVAWRWDCTHHQYSDWAQVQPPRSLPSEWGVLTAWLDWRTFLYENMADFVGWQRAIIRAHDPRHPTMTNIFAFSGREVEMALDPWRMAGQADAIGYDMYPGLGRRLHTQPEYISLFLDMGRSTALHAGSEFWLPELESGPIGGWALGPEYTTKPSDLVRYNLEALGHGAKAILYQGYREWPCIPIHWGALADFEGNATPRYAAAQRINQLIGEHEELFRNAQPPRAEVAIFYDTRNTTLLHGLDALDLLQRAVRGAYRALWRAGYPVEFVNSETLVADTAVGILPYKLLILPAAFLIDQATGVALRAFVERGGTLIAGAKCAWLDGRGWSWARQPGAGLEQLFGVTAGEAEAGIEHVECTIEKDLPQMYAQFSVLNSQFRGYWHQQPLTPHPGAEVLARFADGSAALVRNAVGAGQCFYVGTHLDAAILECPESIGALLALVARADLRPALHLRDAPPTVDAHLLLAGEQRLVLLTNNSAEPAPVVLTLDTPHSAVRELLHGIAVAAHTTDLLTLTLELPAWEGAVLLVGAG